MPNKLLGPQSEGRARVTTTVRPRWKGNQFTGLHCKLDHPLIWKLVYTRWRNQRDENHAGSTVGVALTLGIAYGTPQYAVQPGTESTDTVVGLGLGFQAVNYNNENYPTNAALWGPSSASSLLTNAPGTAGTSFTITTGDGAKFAVNQSAEIGAVLGSGAVEVVLITAISTDTLTVTRTQWATTALNAAAGWYIRAAGYASMNALVVAAGAQLKNLAMVPAASRWDQSYSADQTKTGTIALSAGSFTYQTQSKQSPGFTIGQWVGTEMRQLRALNPALKVGTQVSSQPQNWPNTSSTDNYIGASDTFQQLCEISRQGADRPDYLQFFRAGNPDGGWPGTLRAFAMFRPYWRGERWV